MAGALENAPKAGVWPLSDKASLAPRSSVPLCDKPGVHLVASGSLGLGLTSPLDCNAYLIVDAGRSALIDAGADGLIAARVEALCRDLGCAPPEVLLLTHGHADHSGGAAACKVRWPRMAVCAGAALAELLAGDPDPVSLERARRAGGYPRDYVWTPPPLDRLLCGGEVLPIGTVSLRVLASPGHAAEHMAYLLEREARGIALFSGDHLFPGGSIALEPIPGADVLAYADSMRRVAETSYTALFPGHLMPKLDDCGRSVRLAAERFARLGVPPNLEG